MADFRSWVQSVRPEGGQSQVGRRGWLRTILSAFLRVIQLLRCGRLNR
jgi:hypothetical protein